MAGLTTLTVVLAAVGLVAPHTLEVGRCKEPNAVQAFEATRFTGLWYVIEIFSTTSECMTMTFNLTSAVGDMTVTEAREFYLADMINFDHTYTNTGEMTAKPGQPGKFTVDWPSNIFGDADITIVDTDYDNFAVLAECQPFLLFMRRTSVVILSRQNTLDASIVQQVKSDVAQMGYDVTDFDMIDHSSCNGVGEADFEIALDDDSFSFNGDEIPFAASNAASSDLELPFQPTDTEGAAEFLPEFNEILK